MPRITTFLAYVDQAEAAAKFYVSVFKNSRIVDIMRAPKGTPGTSGGVLTVTFELDGQTFVAMNGGPQFQFTDAVSLMIECKTQKEIDTYWEKLSKGGEKVACGWLKDKFGLRWQVTPTILLKMLGDRDPKKAQRVMAAMLKMKKLDIDKLKKAYAAK